MAIYWYDMGNRVNNAWTAPESESHSKKSANPYHRQQVSPVSTTLKMISSAQELMRSPVKTLTPNSTIREAKDLIKQNRFRHVPIVDPTTTKLIGLVSDRDLLRESASQGSSFMDWMNENNQNLKVVSDFMTKKLLTAHLEEKLENIARAMLLERIGCMLIIDDNEKLAGIITRSDILRLLMSRPPTTLWL